MTDYTIQREQKSRAGSIHTKLSVHVKPEGDIMLGCRECKLVIKVSDFGRRPFDKVPHFSIGHGGGMAFPEVLRAYAILFNEAANLSENKQELDFQI